MSMCACLAQWGVPSGGAQCVSSVNSLSVCLCLCLQALFEALGLVPVGMVLTFDWVKQTGGDRTILIKHFRTIINNLPRFCWPGTLLSEIHLEGDSSTGALIVTTAVSSMKTLLQAALQTSG